MSNAVSNQSVLEVECIKEFNCKTYVKSSSHDVDQEKKEESLERERRHGHAKIGAAWTLKRKTDFQSPGEGENSA